MRLIAMLAALLIVGLLVYKQITPGQETATQAVDVGADVELPKVPNNPNEIKQFGQDMNAFMQEEAAKRAAAIEEAEGK